MKLYYRGQGYLDLYVLVLHSFKHHYSGDSKLSLRKAVPDECCLVRALRAYLSQKPGIPGVLFINQAGVSVDRSQLVHIIKSLIQILGLNPSNYYNSHSLWIGRITDLALEGVSSQEIQLIGRWSSDTSYQAIYGKFTQIK